MTALLAPAADVCATRNRRLLWLPLLVATGFVLAGPMPRSSAQSCPQNPGILSEAAAEAVIASRVHGIYREASLRLLNAIAEQRLNKLGFEPTASDREIAREHIEAILRPGATTESEREIVWPKVQLVIRHPSKWIALGLQDTEGLCAGYAERLPCEASDARDAAERSLTRAVLASAEVCRLEPLPTFSGLPKRLQQYHDLLVADNRFLKQYEHLADLANAPFRKRGLHNQMLYADFFQKALKEGSVGAFASEYLADANPLSRFQAHRDLRPLIGLLLDNRLLN